MAGVKLFSLLILVNLNLVLSGKNDIYEGNSVHGVVLSSQEDLKFLYDLELELNLDIWQRGMPSVRDAFVMVTPENDVEFFSELDKRGIKHYVQIENVVEALEKHEAEVFNYKMSRRNGAVPFNDYPRYAEIDEYMERVAREYPEIASVVNAGNSFEGRSIKYLKISSTNFTDTNKPIYFMDAALHAREWVTPPVALYSIHRLVEDLRDDERDLLENIDWIILPLANPDGYEYSHTDERLWRRTRSYRPEINATCYGVDANRNFDINFNTLGVSSNPCSNTYPGHQAFSEPETQIVRDILLNYANRIQIFMDIHSYGNYVLYAFGDASLPANIAQLHHVGAAMGAVIDARKLPEAPYYAVGNSNLVLYGTSGSAQDYGQTIAPFSYTLELPGYTYMFAVPPEYIEQINAETWPGIVETARLSLLFYRARF